MDDAFRIFPEQASDFAPKYDLLFLFLCVVSVFFAALIFVLILVFALRYRRRHPDERPAPTIESLRLELFYTIVPFGIAMVMFFWGARLYFVVYSDPQDPLDVYVVGKQWMWKVQHPEGRSEINELHVPTGRRVQLTMSSQDVIHSFFVPAFRIKQDALPGRYTTISFQATKPGTYHLFCAEYCGAQHSGMIGTVTVMEPKDYRAWLDGTKPDDAPVVAGEDLYKNLGCVTCHGVEAPSLAGLYGSTVRYKTDLYSDDVKELKADEQYLGESILHSTAKIVEGYQPIMPSFRGQITDEQLYQLVAFIKSQRNAKRTDRIGAGPAGGKTNQGSETDEFPGKSPINPGPSEQQPTN